MATLQTGDVEFRVRVRRDNVRQLQETITEQLKIIEGGIPVIIREVLYDLNRDLRDELRREFIATTTLICAAPGTDDKEWMIRRQGPVSKCSYVVLADGEFHSRHGRCQLAYAVLREHGALIEGTTLETSLNN